MKILKKILTGIVILCTTVAFGQEDWSATFRPGLHFPTSDTPAGQTQIGFGFDFTVTYAISPNLDAYAGWGWNKFDINNTSGDQVAFLEETGYTFGLLFLYPIGEGPISYLVRAGGIYNQLEIENNSGTLLADTGHGFGWQLGAGISYKFTENWFLRPELKYHALSRDNAPNATLDLNYVSFAVGLAVTF